MNMDDKTAATGRADYEQRRVVRIDRLRARAEKAGGEGEARLRKARATASMIPFGQPILVGHHSEKRHRRDATRIDAGYRAGFAAQALSAALSRRAAAAEQSTAISSDDPDAPGRLLAKLAKLEADRDAMKLANAAIQKAQRNGGEWQAVAVAALVAQGFASARAAQLVLPDFAGRIGFAPYKLTNTGAEIRRLAKRVAVLGAQAERGQVADVVIGECTIREADNRVQILFPGKPSNELRAALRSDGFRWAPSAGAWQRQLSPQARYRAEAIASRTV